MVRLWAIISLVVCILSQVLGSPIIRNPALVSRLTTEEILDASHSDPHFTNLLISSRLGREQILNALRSGKADPLWLERVLGHRLFLDWSSSEATTAAMIGMKQFQSEILLPIRQMPSDNPIRSQFYEAITRIMIDHSREIARLKDISLLHSILHFIPSDQLKVILGAFHKRWPRFRFMDLLLEIIRAQDVAMFKTALPEDARQSESLFTSLILSHRAKNIHVEMVNHIFRHFRAPPDYGSLVLNVAMTRRWSQIVNFFHNKPSLYGTIDSKFLLKTLTDWRNDQKDAPLLLSCLSDQKMMSFLSEDQVSTLWERFATARDHSATEIFVENPRIAELLSYSKWNQAFAILQMAPKAPAELTTQMVRILLTNYRISYDFHDWKALFVFLNSEKNFKALTLLFESNHAMLSVPKDELAEFFLAKCHKWDAPTFDAFLSNKYGFQALTLNHRILAQQSLKSSHVDGRYKVEALIRINLKAMPRDLSRNYWDLTFQRAVTMDLYDIVKDLIRDPKTRETISIRAYQSGMAIYEKSLIDRVPDSSRLLDLLTSKDMWSLTQYTLYFIDWMKLIRLSLDEEWASSELLKSLQEDPGRYSVLAPRHMRSDTATYAWSVEYLPAPNRLPRHVHQNIRAPLRHSPSMLPRHPYLKASSLKTSSRTPRLTFVQRPISHHIIPAVPHFRLPL